MLASFVRVTHFQHGAQSDGAEFGSRIAAQPTMTSLRRVGKWILAGSKRARASHLKPKFAT
jgi:hypothetical protein